MTEHSLKAPKIIYQDADLIAVNKPSGLLSAEDGYDRNLPHLTAVLEPRVGKLWRVHRLDKETSGLILLARNSTAHRQLNESFRQRQIQKIYHGLVTPPPAWRQMTIDSHLKINADRKHRTREDKTVGKEALSVCKVLKWFELGVLMEIQIFTGITHQIRAHLRSQNLSIFGDTLYNAGLPIPPIPIERVMLHAHTMAFPHPTTGEWMTLSAPYPDDFRDAYTKLRFTTILDARL